MDPLFDGDAVNTLHIGSSGHCKFLRATREKRLKSRRACLNEHPAGNITGILEGMNRFWRHECNATGSQVMRLFVVEERLLTLLDHEEFILVEVAVQRSATGWSALGPQCKLSSCLRTDQMEGYLFARGMQRVTLARNKADGTRLCSHARKEVAANAKI